MILVLAHIKAQFTFTPTHYENVFLCWSNVSEVSKRKPVQKQYHHYAVLQYYSVQFLHLRTNCQRIVHRRPSKHFASFAFRHCFANEIDLNCFKLLDLYPRAKEATQRDIALAHWLDEHCFHLQFASVHTIPNNVRMFINSTILKNVTDIDKKIPLCLHTHTSK